ncbi:MAG: hypothetical protein NTW74_21745 [Acidobacteria bacterium]|nr:hypothetical protein [Acidobacteriota bacterium]
MRILISILMACATTFAQQAAKRPAANPAPRPKLDLIQLGTFHQGEAEFRSGGGWIGLVPARDGFAWGRFQIKTEKVHDPIGDDAPEIKRATQITLTTPAEAEPLFLLRGLAQLATKPVHTCFDRSENGSFLEQNPILLTCEATAYSVQVTNQRLLQLKKSGKTQTLFTWPKALSEEHAELIWAGDLDGDGKLDLLLDHSDHYNATGLTLYLSTWAAPGQLVGRAASFKTVAC